MGVSRVDFGGETLIDLTGDTVNEKSLLKGYTAHRADGELIEGSAAVSPTISIDLLMVVTGSTSASNAHLYIYGSSVDISGDELSAVINSSGGFVSNELWEISYSRYITYKYTFIPHKKCVLVGFFVNKTDVIEMEAEEHYNWDYNTAVRFAAIM